jgi:transcriptional regulator with XRE-family HTH domain
MAQAKKTKAAKAKPSHKALGRAVAEIRNEKGLTQAALSQKTGLHISYISGIENAARNPTWTVITGLSKALGVKPKELVERAEGS